MKRFITMMLALSIVGVSVGAEMTSLSKQYKINPEKQTASLLGFGLASNDVAKLVASDWDDGVLVNILGTLPLYGIEGSAKSPRMVTVGNFAMLTIIWSSDQATKLVDIITEAQGQPDAVIPAIRLYGKSEFAKYRGRLQPFVDEYFSTAKTPGKLAIFSKAAQEDRDFTMDELVTALFVPEWELSSLQSMSGYSPMILNREKAAKAILDLATTAAKKKLRQEGKTFVVSTLVTTNAAGVVTKTVLNPLTNKVQPVVDALNAPLAIGLEKAFAGLDVKIADQNAARQAFKAFAEKSADQVMNGEVPIAEIPQYLPAVKVLKGVVEYNKWIEVYNGGK
jgi:hypothetical protein